MKGFTLPPGSARVLFIRLIGKDLNQSRILPKYKSKAIPVFPLKKSTLKKTKDPGSGAGF
jgi:hypothetical protein